MSIINQMLKDLEKRSKKPVDPDKRPDPALMQLEIRQRRYRQLFKLLTLLACILLVSDLYVISHRPTSHSLIRQSASATVQLSAVVKPAAAEAVAFVPVNLTGMTVDFQHGMTTLRFLLSKPAFYRISSNDTTSVYQITFEHTLPVADLPPADYSGTAIELLTMTPKPDGSLQIMLQLKKGAHLEQAGIFSGASPEFQVTLSWLPPVVPPLSAGLLPASVLSQPLLQDSFSKQSLQTAQRLVEAGDVDKAISLLNSVITIAPDFHPAREALIRILMQQGRADDAESVLRAGMSRYPQWLPYVDLQARWLVDRGLSGQALSLMGRYTPSLENHQGFYALMAALYQRQNQPQIAATLYQQLLSSDPHNAKWWLGLAIALDATNRHAEAMNAYMRALQEKGSELSPELKAWIETQLNPV